MASTAASGEAAAPSRWIFGPTQDAAFVLGTPLAIFGVVAVARAGGWLDGLVAFGLALAMAHYLPGMLRAYGDPTLFRRFRVRLIAAPLVLGAFATAFAYWNLHAVLLLAILWGGWHWAMQIYGFARIYDARAGSVDPVTARLDRALCLLWFVAALYVLNDDLGNHISLAYRIGTPLIPNALLDGFRSLWLALTGGVTLFYVVHSARRVAAGRPPSPLKLLFLLTSFAYLGFTESVTDHALLGYVMFEAWHDVQYLALTWQVTAHRAARPPAPGRFLPLLFRPGALRIAAYVGLCLAFGMLTHAGQLFSDVTVVRIVAALVLSVAMLHYYLDGFIWKIREKDNREDLGVRSEEPSAEPITPAAALPGWLRHAALWLLFVVPAGFGLYLETQRGGVRDSEIRRSLVELFPQSPEAQADRGYDLAEMGRLQQAERHLLRAVELEPDLYRAHLALALLPGSDPERGPRHAEQTLRLRPQDPRSHHVAGLAKQAAGRAAEARAHLERALALDPDYEPAKRALAALAGEDADAAAPADS